MQRPAELVPIRYGPSWFVIVRESSVKAPMKVTAFWQNPENFGQNLEKNQQNSGKICKIFGKNKLKNRKNLTKQMRIENEIP